LEDELGFDVIKKRESTPKLESSDSLDLREVFSIMYQDELLEETSSALKG